MTFQILYAILHSINIVTGPEGYTQYILALNTECIKDVSFSKRLYATVWWEGCRIGVCMYKNVKTDWKKMVLRKLHDDGEVNQAE